MYERINDDHSVFTGDLIMKVDLDSESIFGTTVEKLDDESIVLTNKLTKGSIALRRNEVIELIKFLAK